MAIKLVGTFIEVILKNNFGEFKVQNNEVDTSNIVISDLINIITQVYFVGYFIEHLIKLYIILFRDYQMILMYVFVIHSLLYLYV